MQAKERELFAARNTISSTLDPLLSLLARDYVDDNDLTDRIRKLFKAKPHSHCRLYFCCLDKNKLNHCPSPAVPRIASCYSERPAAALKAGLGQILDADDSMGLTSLEFRIGIKKLVSADLSS